MCEYSHAEKTSVKGLMMTEKPLDASYATDKAQSGGYLKRYEHRFCDLCNEPMALLELGINEGGARIAELAISSGQVFVVKA